MSTTRSIDVYCPNCGKFLSAQVSTDSEKGKLPRHNDEADGNVCGSSGKSFGLPSGAVQRLRKGG